MKIEKYTFGMGDRFARQGHAQLQAIIQARHAGLEVYPVWNKSNREHSIVHSQPDDVRAEADAAVGALGWDAAYHVDADHIGLRTVDAFIAASDFYTVDVADFIGAPPSGQAVERFTRAVQKYLGELAVPGCGGVLRIDADAVRAAAAKFLRAVEEAGRVYRHIEERKGRDEFVTEISVDETDSPHTPTELFLILVMIAEEGIPVQTVAPKFVGRFNKGVDYVGDLARFEQEFEEDLCVLAFAVNELGLPGSLKLSMHSGSDKFSLYPVINRLLKKHDAGLHVKTAGTTWLEEMIGLAEAGGDGLEVAREIYRRAYPRFAELVKPYAPVVDIDSALLPSLEEVAGWDSARYAAALRHDRTCPQYNRHLRQFLHVSFKVAAEMGGAYLDALAANQSIIARNVTANLFERHIVPIFG